MPRAIEGSPPLRVCLGLGRFACLPFCWAWRKPPSIPFGDTAFVRADGLWQYVGYTGWASEILHGEGSPFYSFAKSLGGVRSAFPRNGHVPHYAAACFCRFGRCSEILLASHDAQTAACGVTCHVFLRKRFSFHGIVHVLLSCSYGTMMCLFYDRKQNYVA